MDHPTYSKKFQTIGFIDDDFHSQGMEIYGSKVIGTTDDIKKIVKKNDVGLIILADNQMDSRKYSLFGNAVNFAPAKIVVAPDIFGSLNNLDGGSMNNETKVNLNNFQCRHCLARYTNEQVEK
jgi:FlaA1/EpsC-like NDP-sugar epimerase